VLVNKAGVPFMAQYHEMADLAPRDVVARSIDRELKASGEPCAFLDLTHLDPDHIRDRFPHLVQICARFGIEMAGGRVPVVPAAHYMCGGVAVDLDARSNLPGLFVIGESACTGVHGANRLASNSLLEAVFFASRASAVVPGEPDVITGDVSDLAARFDAADARAGGPEIMVLEHDWDLVRRVMWDYVGIVRDRERLDIALERLRGIRRTVEELYAGSLINADVVELRNIALLGELIVLSARARRESRGLHFTLDHPEKLGQAADTILRRGVPLEGEICREFPGVDRE